MEYERLWFAAEVCFIVSAICSLFVFAFWAVAAGLIFKILTLASLAAGWILWTIGLVNQ